jgi:PAS domain S-box-containing protein
VSGSSHETTHPRLPRIADACALLTATIGLLAMAGWLFGIDALKRVLPGFVPMTFSSALALALAGAGLWWRDRSPVRLSLGGLVTLFGAVSLAEWLTGTDFGIDRLFVSASLARAGVAPGRMAHSAALCFVLLGVSLALARGTRGKIGSSAASGLLDQGSELLALVATIVGMLSLVGYVTGAEYLRQLPGSIGMALGTAVALAVLGTGIISAAEGLVVRSMRFQGTGRALWIGFGVLTCLLASIGVVFAVNIQKLEEDVAAQANIARIRRELTFELENDVLGYDLNTRLAPAGETRAWGAASEDALDLEDHLAAYAALAKSARQRQLAARFAAEWRAVHALGESLVLVDGAVSSEQQDRFAAASLRLGRMLEEIRADAVDSFKKREAATWRDLQQADDLPLALLVIGVLLALLTSAAVARSVLRQEQRRRRAMEQLTESEVRFGRAQEMAHVGSWELDLSSNRLTWSDEVYRIFGVEPREFGATYEAFLEAVHPADRAAVDAAYSSSVSGGDPYDIEYRVVQKRTGAIRVVHARCEHGRDASGRIVTSLGMVHDITERKRAEQELRTANLRLAQSNRRKNEFLAVLSHELRNPLAPIANSLYILDRASPGCEQANRAKQVIGRQVSHLSNLVNDLLEVTRISRNKVELHKEPIELFEVVSRSVEDNRSLFESAGVHLELEPRAAPIVTLADRTRVEQIIGNLLQNAAKFTCRGGHTRVSVSAEGADAAVVRVVDDGIGLERETLGRLFEPFMQVDRSLDRCKGGLGLGLALVKGLVKLHGGSISVHSDGLDKGTAFCVRLPLHAGDVRQSSVPPPADLAPARRRRLLVIEDNIDAADTLREALELGNHEVMVAHSGPEGLAKAREFRPEVVLCDIGLPGMDGYEVARVLRNEEQFKDTLLVALSGYVLAEDRRRSAEAGFDRHLAKPPDLEQIEQVLAEAPVSRLRGELRGSVAASA